MAQEQRPVVLVIDGILAPLLGARPSALFGEVERA